MLLLDRRRNRGGELLDFPHPAGNAGDGVHRALRRGLHRRNLGGDHLGRLGRLHRQRFDFGRHHRKALAGGAGARGFDRGVERQQVGLPGDALDQLNHVVDFLRRLRQACDLFVGRLRFGGSGAHDFAGAQKLVIDFGDRSRQFLRRRRGDIDAIIGLVRSLHRAGSVRGGFIRHRRQRRGGRLHGRDGFGHRVQHALDAVAKPADRLIDHGSARRLLAKLGACSLRVAALGDVVMRADPVEAAGNGTIDDGDGAAVVEFGDEALGLAGFEEFQKFGAVLLRITAQAASLEAMADDVLERGTGFDDVRRQPVDLAVAGIADHETPGGVEHHHALCHVVECEIDEAARDIATAQPPNQTPQQHGSRQAGQKAGEPDCGDWPPIADCRKTGHNCGHRASCVRSGAARPSRT